MIHFRGAGSVLTPNEDLVDLEAQTVLTSVIKASASAIIFQTLLEVDVGSCSSVRPFQLFEKLAQVLNLVEETGSWPLPLTCGLISLIQNGEGSAPQKLRPIGLMASVYRLWASLRIRDIMHWQEKWADAALYGYRLGKRAEDVWMDLSLSVESAPVDVSADLVGISID